MFISGNEEVWHGNLDIIVNNDLIVEPVNEDTGSPGGKSIVEVKLKSSSLSKNPQIIAQAIVFSFLQKQTHPEREHFLTPCIGVGYTELLVMFYDAEHDVLLESAKMPVAKAMQPNKFSLIAVIVSWLVVNYKYLCTGLTEEMGNFYKADFFKHAMPKLDVYKEKLRMGNVAVLNTSESNQPHYFFKDNSYLRERRKKLKEVVEEVEEKFSHAAFSGQ